MEGNIDFTVLGLQATVLVVLIVAGLQRLGMPKRHSALAALGVAWALGGLALAVALFPQIEIYVRYFLMSTLVGLAAPLAVEQFRSRAPGPGK